MLKLSTAVSLWHDTMNCGWNILLCHRILLWWWRGIQVTVFGVSTKLFWCRAWLVLKWRTICGYTILVCNQLPRPTQPSTLGGMENEFQQKGNEAMWLGVKASSFHLWINVLDVACKTVWSLVSVYHTWCLRAVQLVIQHYTNNWNKASFTYFAHFLYNRICAEKGR